AHAERAGEGVAQHLQHRAFAAAIGTGQHDDVRLLRWRAERAEVGGLEVTELVDGDFLNEHPPPPKPTGGPTAAAAPPRADGLTLRSLYPNGPAASRSGSRGSVSGHARMVECCRTRTVEKHERRLVC